MKLVLSATVEMKAMSMPAVELDEQLKMCENKQFSSGGWQPCCHLLVGVKIETLTVVTTSKSAIR